ncbi:MAG: BatD family protein [Porticoccaceae bacterium]
MRAIFLNIVISLIILGSSLSWAELQLIVDRSELEANETLQAVVRYSGSSSGGDPDFSPIEKDFEILSTSRQQQYSLINGQSQSSTDWKMLLLPKRTGQLNLPALNYQGERSQAQKIMVRAPGKSPGGRAQPVYTETSIDKTSVHIQEQIILTVRLITSVQLQDFSLSELDITDALVQRVGENQFQKVINGKNHLVLEIKFALFPQVAGKLTIPALRIGAYEARGFSQFGSFSTRGNRIIRLTEEKTIDVLPKPAHIAVDQWMPSSQLQITETWSNNSNRLKVGEPITRTINIRAQGLTAAQIQPLPELRGDDFKIYPDQAKLEDQINTGGVLGLRTETLAIVPNRAGALTLPAIAVRWWDTDNQRMQTSTLPAKSFQVIAADTPVTPTSESNEVIDRDITHNAPDTQTPAGDPQQQPSQLIRWSLALNALLIAALVALLYLRRWPTNNTPPGKNASNQDNPDLRQSLKLIEKQAADRDLKAMRDSILKWGRLVFPNSSLTSLEQLAELMEGEGKGRQLSAQFAQLDQHLFNPQSDSSQFDAGTIIASLKAFKPSQTKSSKTSAIDLKPLYPKHR